MKQTKVDGRYSLLDQAGSGPLFTTWRARGDTGDTPVAVKIPHPELASDAAFVDAMSAGLQAASNLRHPTICRVLEFGQHDGAPYAVTDYVAGTSLKERVRRTAPFTVAITLEIACGIAEALAQAHAAGLVHGDLRPENVIVSPTGAIRVTDFGVSRAIAVSRPAQVAVLKLAAPYHAPELSITTPGSVAGDIYALGALLYEMLTGSALYEGGSAEDVADRHTLADVPSPRSFNPSVPRPLDGIVQRCLQKAPNDRYPSARAVLADLRALQDAMRFGKSLSWSPMESAGPKPEPVAAPPPVPTPAPPAAAMEPREGDEPMSRAGQSRLRERSERANVLVQAALAGVTLVIVLAAFGLIWVWATRWAVPAAEPVPALVGKSIDDVRAAAATLHVRLLEHAEYSDRPRGIVYKTDPAVGSETRPNHVLNVWYSKGSEYVNVPDVTKMLKDDAAKKLQDAGLTLGTITPEYSPSVPENAVLRQDVSSRKRVLHDTAVNLVVSEGPKPTETADTTGAGQPGNTDSPPASGAGDGTDTNSGDLGPQQDTQSLESQTANTFDRSITIPNDKLGNRQVRITYEDAGGTPVTVVDEEHTAGDRIPVTFVYYGKKITLSIYYDGRLKWRRTFDPKATQDQTIR